MLLPAILLRLLWDQLSGDINETHPPEKKEQKKVRVLNTKFNAAIFLLFLGKKSYYYLNI